MGSDSAGYETGLSATTAVLDGVDLLGMGGLLDALMTFDLGKAVLDHEFALMLKRVKRGMEFDQDNMALDLIASVGPGGILMERRHTLKRMRSTAFLPEIADPAPIGLPRKPAMPTPRGWNGPERS